MKSRYLALFLFVTFPTLIRAQVAFPVDLAQRLSQAYPNPTLNWQPSDGIPIEDNAAGAAQYTCRTAPQADRVHIYCNPVAIGNYPWYVVEFTKVHEHGHVNQLRNYPQIFATRMFERDADCYAAFVLATTDPDVVEAYAWFSENVIRWLGAQDGLHESGYESATRVRACRDASAHRAAIPVDPDMKESSTLPKPADVCPGLKAEIDAASLRFSQQATDRGLVTMHPGGLACVLAPRNGETAAMCQMAATNDQFATSQTAISRCLGNDWVKHGPSLKDSRSYTFSTTDAPAEHPLIDVIAPDGYNPFFSDVIGTVTIYVKQPRRDKTANGVEHKIVLKDDSN